MTPARLFSGSSRGGAFAQETKNFASSVSGQVSPGVAKSKYAISLAFTPRQIGSRNLPPVFSASDVREFDFQGGSRGCRRADFSSARASPATRVVPDR